MRTLEIKSTEGKIIFVQSPKDEIEVGDRIIYKADRGEEIGEVIRVIEGVRRGLKGIRKSSAEDIERYEKNKQREDEAYETCKSKIEEMKLPMRLVGVNVGFSTIKFYFLAEKRVDFRKLVRELGRTFKMKIEMRQIGVRDYAKQLGGYGLCGNSLCCRRFLREFEPITLSLVKLQRLSCGIDRITGVCGRLMCCLAYEKEFYKEISEKLPEPGVKLKTDKGEAEVVNVDIFDGEITLKYEDGKMEKVPYKKVFSENS